MTANKQTGLIFYSLPAVSLILGTACVVFISLSILSKAKPFILYASAALILTVFVTVISCRALLKVDWLRSRKTVVLNLLFPFISLAFAASILLLYIRYFPSILDYLNNGNVELEELITTSSHFLVPVFFAVLHIALCIFHGLSGYSLRLVNVSNLGSLLSLPTMYFLITYALATHKP